MTRLHAFGLGALVAVVAILFADALRPSPGPVVVPDSAAIKVAMEREFAAFVALDSVTAALEDSSSAWAARDDSAQARAAAAAVRSQVIASDLEPRLDSTESALFAEHQAATAEIIAAKDEQIATLETENAALYATIATHIEYEATLSTTLAAERGLSVQYRIAAELAQAHARRVAVTSRVNQAVAVAGSGKVCYDAINDGSTGLAVGSCLVAGLVAVAGGAS